MSQACPIGDTLAAADYSGKGATTGGSGGGSGPPKSWTDHPNFLRSSARNWVYHPYFVLYNNVDQGIGRPTLKTWLHPCTQVTETIQFVKLGRCDARPTVTVFQQLVVLT